MYDRAFWELLCLAGSYTIDMSSGIRYKMTMVGNEFGSNDHKSINF
jgi:hypothetical protein